METVPHNVFESSQDRAVRVIHSLIIALLISVVLLFLSNLIWLHAWVKTDRGSTRIVNKDSVSNFIGGSGVINDGDNRDKDSEEIT